MLEVSDRTEATVVCGLAGIIARAGATVDPAALEAMGTIVEHRGPDDRGALGWSPGGTVRIGGPDVVAGARLGLVHRRLSILDLSTRGRQPMTTPDKRFAVVYNGEVYNYRELRRELEPLGHSFATGTDTEVVLAAWAAWGAAALPRFIGMFAFALLDTVAGELFLVRDPFGMKPLFHAQAASGFVFASELKAILAVPGVRRTADPQRTYEFLRFAVTDRDERTFFAEIQQVRPAHLMRVSIDSGAMVSTRYWRPAVERVHLSFADAASALRDRFLETVSLHLRSDVPVGAALSGGIDSSAVVSTMHRLRVSTLDLHTFTYVGSNGAPNEEPYASLVARQTGAVRHLCHADSEHLSTEIAALIRTHDEPFVSSSVYAQNRVFASVARAGIRVTLDGQGADEYLAGYPSFVSGRLASLIKRGRFHDAWELAQRVGGGEGAAGSLARSVALMLPPGLRNATRRLTGRPAFPSWLNGSWLAARGAGAPVLGRPTTRNGMIAQLEEAVTDISLPMLLRYADRNAMAYSVESRMPFLTTSLVEFCLSLPEDYLLSADGTTKSVFRAAMRGIVPDAILDRRDKVGFVTPEHAWLNQRADTIERVFAAADTIPPCLEVAGLRTLWTRARTSRDMDAVGATWRALNLAEWSQALDIEW